MANEPENAESAGIARRKLDHLDLCATTDVEARGKTTLLEEVDLVHDSLPELALDHVDLRTRLLGKVLAAPLVITGMTGGVGRAVEINRALAQVAEELGLGFGLGSQRAMLEAAEVPPGYRVRDVAPNALLLANIGAVQAAASPTAAIAQLVEAVGADALAIHLNPGQELIQPEGDRDFRGCVAAIARLAAELPVPVVVKETGCGLGPGPLKKLRNSGVTTVDVSGAGGTTWVGVESRRATDARGRLGEALWDWGVPTAVATVLAVREGYTVVASGGLRSGHDVARAIALGATAGGMALPMLRAFHTAGLDGARAAAREVIEELRAVFLLTGSANAEQLRAAPRVLGPRLERWLAQL